MQVPWWVHSDQATQAGPWALLVHGFVMTDSRPVLAPRHLRRSIQPQPGTLYSQDSASHHCVWPPLRVGSQHMKRTLCDGLDWGLKVRQELPQTHFHMFKSSKFTGLCNYWYHHNPILEKCHLPKRLPQACWQLIAIPTASPRSGCLLCILLVPPRQVLSLFPSIRWTEGSPTFPGKRQCLYRQPSCRGWTQMHICMYPHTCTHTLPRERCNTLPIQPIREKSNTAPKCFQPIYYRDGHSFQKLQKNWILSSTINTMFRNQYHSDP